MVKVVSILIVVKASQIYYIRYSPENMSFL